MCYHSAMIITNDVEEWYKFLNGQSIDWVSWGQNERKCNGQLARVQLLQGNNQDSDKE